MKIPKLQFGNITADVPIVQGAMGVSSKTEYERMSREALEKEIRKAKKMTNGHLAVNFMGVLSNADDLITTAVKEGIKIIVYGAGLPAKLPGLVEDSSVSLLPIVSSARVAELILRVWDKRYERTADAIILEGPLAGGHLGFSEEQLNQPAEYSLENLLPEVLGTVKAYEDKYGKKIPVIVGGGIFSGMDIARMLSLGASGVQMATRFVCTEECDVSQEFKQSYLDAEEEDIVIIKSPVGMPGRAIHNKFLKDLEIKGKLKIKCPYRCLSVCKVGEARYCIALALLNSYFGDVDNGLIFCGQNAYRCDKIVTVKELISDLLGELEAA
jgi:NAD(P)H-dependent flavin oxidoreductase YrpB (nitropropane dioxygenase family)